MFWKIKKYLSRHPFVLLVSSLKAANFPKFEVIPTSFLAHQPSSVLCGPQDFFLFADP